MVFYSFGNYVGLIDETCVSRKDIMKVYMILQSRELKNGWSSRNMFSTPCKNEAELWVQRLNELSKQFNYDFDATYSIIDYEDK